MHEWRIHCCRWHRAGHWHWKTHHLRRSGSEPKDRGSKPASPGRLPSRCSGNLFPASIRTTSSRSSARSVALESSAILPPATDMRDSGSTWEPVAALRNRALSAHHHTVACGWAGADLASSHAAACKDRIRAVHGGHVVRCDASLWCLSVSTHPISA